MFEWGELASKVYPNIDEIRPQEAWDLAEKGEVVLIDVRLPHEIANAGKCPGALNIPLYMMRHTADRKSPHFDAALEADKRFAIYGKDRKQALRAARVMKKLGHDAVHNLGAFREWTNANLPVER